MTDNEKPIPFDLHAIQLTNIIVRQLHITVHPNSASTAPEDMKMKLNLQRRHSEYNAKDHQITVSVRLQIGERAEEGKTPSTPLILIVELTGEFVVDESRFPVDRLSDWANVNAPFILMPFLREQVYSLSQRCGFNPIVLPLTEVPTIKIEKPQEQPPPEQK